jgi:hypothetical protein
MKSGKVICKKAIVRNGESFEQDKVYSTVYGNHRNKMTVFVVADNTNTVPMPDNVFGNHFKFTCNS